MHLIITHEQSDFDAIGASLGAFLMNEQALPVLSRRLNRNVRAFMTIYGAELPFIELTDLPNEAVETITLVDTQALATLRGASTKTRVQVVDHHTLRPDLSETWNVTVDQVGACTTLFVEGLREHNGSLNPLHATLMLLGIYEDTGSLTYSSTTARDARAVGYLLDQGASLEIAVRFLNPGLSPDQLAAYDRLLSTAEIIDMDGLTMLVATTEALELSDEISSIAHKIRDLLDPAALFLLVRTTEGIRLVARSTTDRVDVSTLASHFGGGGHDRAAAALIRLPSANPTLPYQAEGETPLEAAKRELIRDLTNCVRPSITVRQIMSRQPKLFSPDTPVEKAAQFMQRYGYEGYPVVQNGKTIGLLTRRAVDRAISHKLNLTAASLMDAGEVTVAPKDSIEHLRDVIINSGWGQVPVVDPDTGQIIGIATRTDLLKHMTGYTPVPGQDNLTSRLDRALSPSRLALLKAIAEESHRLHMAIYIVGGFVRDLLLNRPGLDFDLVIEGDAIQLGRALEQRFGGRILTHTRFGTAKWSIQAVHAQIAAQLSANIPLNAHDLPDNLDLISARTEFYDYPTALPTVERSSIKLDLHRRDFTMNTLAVRLDGRHYGELYDYWGGFRDLKNGIVRVLHSLSFVDDPTRQLRAVRFEQRFGFQIEARTLQLMQEAIPLIRHLSGDRLRHELNLILQEERAIAMLDRLNELGLLTAIHPDIPWSTPLSALLQRVLTTSLEVPGQDSVSATPISDRKDLAYLVWWIDLPIKTALEIADRLHLSGSFRADLVAGSKLWEELPTLPGLSVSEITFRLDRVPLIPLIAIQRRTTDEAIRQILTSHITVYRHIQPKTSGNTLMALGIPPGPIYKEILTDLRAAWLDDKIKNDDQEQDLLVSLLDAIRKREL
jgi:tRNA nucleotidyltransferase (CCA-adding enzyme)